MGCRTVTNSHNRQLEPFHYHLRPGYIFANSEPSLITAELGSGVAVCLWDRVRGIGGMSLFQLPRPRRQERPTARYGNLSISTLIRMLVKMGARLENLEAQILGGGHRYPQTLDIGRRNIKIARRILKRSRIPVVSEDIGGILCRRILYHTRTNEVLCMKTHKSRPQVWYPHYSF